MVRSGKKLVVCGAAVCGAYMLLGQSNFAMPTTRATAAPRSLRGGSVGGQADSYVAFEPDKVVAEESPVEAAGNFARTALAVLAALAVAFVPMDDAQAARSGGRMGGGGGGMGRRAPPPRSSSSRTSSTTNVNVGVGVAPPIYGSPFGSPFGFGGFGFGMPFFPPLFGPSIAIGGGSSATDAALQNQQRQDERVMDQQKNEIDKMQKEIAELKAAKAVQK